MLAVALLVSAISFTRVGAGENQTAFAAHTTEPDMKELAIDASGWKWNVPLQEDADGNLAVFKYRPTTYKNYFAFLGGGYLDISGVKLSDTSASMEPSATISNRPERLYAYYKLPDVLISLDAKIEVSANLDSAVKFTKMRSTYKFISSATGVTKIEENSNSIEGAYNAGTTFKVTSDNQYILVCAGGEEDGGEKSKSAGLKSRLRSSLSITRAFSYPLPQHGTEQPNRTLRFWTPLKTYRIFIPPTTILSATLTGH